MVKFRVESTTPLHDETEQEWSKIISKQALVYPVTVQEQPIVIDIPKVM